MTKLGVATWPFIIAVLAKANGEKLSTGEVTRRASELSLGKSSVTRQHVVDELDRLATKGLVNNVGEEGVLNAWVLTDKGREQWNVLSAVLVGAFSECT